MVTNKVVKSQPIGMILSLAQLLLVPGGETPPFVALGPAVADCPVPETDNGTTACVIPAGPQMFFCIDC
jgi:hypothetical protein